MRIQIICRGSSSHGLGHISRAKSFAKKVAGLHDIEIVSIVPEELHILFWDVSCSIKFAAIDTQIIPFVESYCPDILLFDMIAIDEIVFERVCLKSKINGTISPIFSHMHLLDVVFTRTRKFENIPDVSIYGGLEYAVFGDSCIRINSSDYKSNLEQPDLSVAISMGGADASNKTLLILKELVKIKNNVTFWVLLGEGYSHSYEALVNCMQGNPHHEVLLAKTNRSMWRIMRNCSLAILSGGLTTVESVYAGLPSINLFEKPEHMEAVSEELFASGVCIDGGLIADNSHETLVERLNELNANRQTLLSMHMKSRDLVDDNGVYRIIDVLQELLSKK